MMFVLEQKAKSFAKKETKDPHRTRVMCSELQIIYDMFSGVGNKMQQRSDCQDILMGSSLMRMLHHSSVRGQNILFSVSHCVSVKMLNNIQHPESEPMKTALSYAQKHPRQCWNIKHTVHAICVCHLRIIGTHISTLFWCFTSFCSNWPSVSLVTAYIAICEQQSYSIGEQSSSGFGIWQHWTDGVLIICGDEVEAWCSLISSTPVPNNDQKARFSSFNNYNSQVEMPTRSVFFHLLPFFICHIPVRKPSIWKGIGQEKGQLMVRAVFAHTLYSSSHYLRKMMC